MQLLYVWIEDYKNIKKQGFNFSSEFTFTYDKESGVLTIEDNPNYIEGFFGENISNIMAIVGKNGSGKSTLLDFLGENVLNGVDKTSQGQIVVLKLNGKKGLFIYSRFFNTNDTIEISLKTNKLTNQNIEKSNNGYLNYDEEKFRFNRISTNSYKGYDITPSIFYSTNFEDEFTFSSPNDNHSDLIINISSNYWLRRSFEEGDFQYYDYQEIRRILNFLHNASNKFKNKIPFTFPENVNITIEILTLPNTKNWDKWKKYIDKEAENLRNEYETIRDAGKLDNDNHKSIRIRDMKKFLSELFLKYLFNGGNDINFDNSEGNNVWERLWNYNDNVGFNNSSNLKSYAEYLLKYLIENHHFNYMRGIKESYNFSTSIENALTFIDKTKNIIRYNPSFVKFNWYYGNISTGEKAFINLLARFWEVIYIDGNKGNRFEVLHNEYDTYRFQEKIYDIIILIDEGETGFHPEWQRQYLYLLIETLPEIFKDKKLQIILTSHSPFVLSDLPKENVIFLDIDNEGNCIVSDMEKHKQTFGANIHTLLSDGFFMEGGLMGEFAKGKIQDVLKWIDNKEVTKKEEILKIINLIGEPIIHNKLAGYFKEKFGEESPAEKVSRLRRELAEAEKKLE